MKSSLRYSLTFILMLSSIFIWAQQTISGVVNDSDGLPLEGATVIIKQTGEGTVTGLNGDFSIVAANGNTLVVSYVGLITQEIEVLSTDRLNIVLENDIAAFSEIVVTTTRQPIRKIQATTAINSISSQDIATTQPESFTEAIENTPGITVNNASGRKGSFNIRGFPGGNVYTTTLIDGLPVSAISNLSAGTQEFYGIDPNVERIEVVRGSAATLFGRAAGAGAVNIISKVGGTEHKGSFSVTKYENKAGEGHQFEGDLDYRFDVNFNGPINDKLRYNVGGFIINDSGFKEQFAKDRGAQLRGNLDWLISKNSSIRLSAGYLDNQFQNITDNVWDLDKNRLADGFENFNTGYNDPSQLDFTAFAVGGGDTLRDAQTGMPLTNNPGENQEDAKGGNIGLDVNLDLGGGWLVTEKVKYQRFNWNDINELSFTGFFTENSNLFRFNSGAKQNNSDFISETRIQKLIQGANSKHNLSAGLYIGNGERDRLGLNYSSLMNVSTRPTFSWFGGSPPRRTYTISGTTSHREERATAIFLGDEMVFDEKLSVNLALRYDWLTSTFSNNPEKIRSNGQDYDPAETVVNEIDFKDFSFSIGTNYLLGEVSAVYANFVRAFSLPSISLASNAPENNEIINNFEVGYRSRFGDLTVDLAVFNTKINNRVASVFDADLGAFVSRPSGSNKILGGEVALTYAPDFARGLLLRGGFTLQQSQYVDFLVPLSKNSSGEINADLDNLMGLKLAGSGNNLAIDVEGNQVQETPKAIINLGISYNGKRVGADFSGYTYTGRYGDVFNLTEVPNLSIYNIGAYVKIPMQNKNELKLGVRIKNLFDGADPLDLFVSSGNDAVLLEKQNNPDPAGRLAWVVVQNPRRATFTLTYSF